VKIELNGDQRGVQERMSLAGLIDDMGIVSGRIATLVNDVVIPASNREETVLQDGDRVEILTFAAGG